MADTPGQPPPAPPQPGPPAGFQRPGIPGAGNILDPEVRGELREKLMAAKPDRPDAAPAPPAQGDIGVAEKSEPAKPNDAVAPPAPAAPKRHLAGPYPHGDVDLSGLQPNVIPARPNRTKGARRFYFLAAQDQSAPQGGREPG